MSEPLCIMLFSAFVFGLVVGIVAPQLLFWVVVNSPRGGYQPEGSAGAPVPPGAE